jgi:hypothetical protein
MAETYNGDAYCVKCKEKRDFEGIIRVSDSGRRMAIGKCSVCGTRVNRILGKDPNWQPSGAYSFPSTPMVAKAPVLPPTKYSLSQKFWRWVYFKAKAKI